MKHKLAIITTALALVLPWMSALCSPAAAQDSGGRCLSKQEIQERIESGQFQQLFEAMASAGVHGKIIGAGRVCRVQGEWQWEISVMDDTGQSKVVNLPAR